MVRVLLSFTLCFTAFGYGQADRVTVYAAASLSTVLSEIGALVREEGLTMRLSVGSSSTLAKQIVQGAPADVYLSANVAWMDYVEARDYVEPGFRVDLAGNTMVVIAPKDDVFGVSVSSDFDLSSAFEGRLALGDPDHVPAGIYAKQALRSLGWWEGVSGRLAPTVDVRGAVAFVERGECAAGVVYATDAAVSDRVVVVADLPEETHDAIVYPAAVIKGRMTEGVRAFWALLTSERVSRVFERHGFKVLAADQK